MKLNFWRWLSRWSLKHRNALEPIRWFEGFNGVETPEDLVQLFRNQNET